MLRTEQLNASAMSALVTALNFSIMNSLGMDTVVGLALFGDLLRIHAWVLSLIEILVCLRSA